ncbi:hypothetical protein [Halosegnis longus]|uniref:hypothetical protein n=1 Tax=Halosegnis longus TaxID=2216012 RepID=UPI001561CF7E|nr:hypothetical protein [Halosegnis longus]
MSAQEDWVRSNPRPASHDGRATTRTTFYDDTHTSGPSMRDRPNHKQKSWTDLAVVNDDAYARDVSRGGQNFAADKRRWVETFAGQLEATSYQKQQAVHVIDNIDMGPYKGARLSSEVVALGVLSMLIDADVRDIEYRTVERDAMGVLLSDLNADRDDLRQVRRLIHKHDYELLFPE